MMYEIKSRRDGTALFSLECGALKLCVEAAVSAKADLRGADLRGADLHGADLRGADLHGADLHGADLRGAYLGGADLGGADLRGAYLGGAYLGGADLGGADLRGADLGGADLRWAYLGGADLRWADLGGGAKWRDGIVIQRQPIQIYGLGWPVTILDAHMQIGCELHTFAEWRAFKDSRIRLMDSSALKFWKHHGSALLALCATRESEPCTRSSLEQEKAA
jgi:hypothetical protein